MSPLSTYVYAYAPGFSAETTHYHDVDQIQFITLGEEWMGNRAVATGRRCLHTCGKRIRIPSGAAGLSVATRWLWVWRCTSCASARGLVTRSLGSRSPAGLVLSTHIRRSSSMWRPRRRSGLVRSKQAHPLLFRGALTILLVEPSGYDDLSLAAVTLDSEVTLPAHAQDCGEIGYMYSQAS